MVDLDELELLLAKATPAPWKGNAFYPHITSGLGSNEVLVAQIAVNTYRDQGRYNEQLIAALRNSAEELIRDARRWREHEDAMAERGHQWAADGERAAEMLKILKEPT